MRAEVYFRSPFGHLPVRFAQTRDSSSLIFSANLEPSFVPLRGREAEKAVFTPPPVYPRMKRSTMNIVPSGATALVVTSVTQMVA